MILKRFIQLISCSILMFLIVQRSDGQIVDIGCQTEDVAVEDLERKDFEIPSGNTSIHSEGSMHNFTLPLEADYGPCKIISNISIVISAFGVDLSNLPPDCAPTPLPYYYNIALGCPDFTPASCDLANLLGEPNTPTFTNQNLSYNGDFDFGENLSVDIVPVMNINCTNGQSALTTDGVVLDYEICVTVTITDATSDLDVDLGPDVSVCPNETTTIDAGFFVDSDYLWDPNGEITQMITVGSGNYTVTVTDADGCTDTDEISILEFPEPNITFDPAMPAACDNAAISVSVNETYDEYNWTGGLTGQTVMLTPGIYDVTVTDGNDCTNVNSIEITNVPPPNAGIDNFLDVCNDGSLYNLDELLLAHDAGGTWSDDDGSGVDVNANPLSVDFDGVVPGSYNYTYTVAGSVPCPPDEATISITVFEQNNAGTSATEQFCADPGDLDFFNLIGNPPSGGTWSDLSGSGVDLTNPFIVDMNGVPPGTYIYQYLQTANGACPEVSETLTINILDAANAGSDNFATVCEGTSFDLLDLVFGANDTGTFIDTDGSGALTGSIVNTAGLAGQTFNFTFEVGSTGSPCGVDQAIFTLNIETSLSAGDDASDSFCAGGDINLLDILTNEDPGGNFTDLDGSGGLSGSILNTDDIIPGTYMYQYGVGDGVTCPEDNSIVTLTFFEDPSTSFPVTSLTICAESCDSILIDLTGTSPYEFPLSVYSATSGNLIVSDTIITSNNTYSFTTCNSIAGNTFSNDTLNLLTDSTWFIIIPSIRDANCFEDSPSNFDTIFINTVSNSIVNIDTSACLSDTLDIGGVLFFEGNDFYSDTLAGEFCDSIVTVNVIFSDLDTIEFNPSICSGDSILIQGIWFNETNTAQDITIDNAVGCDTFITIQVDIYPQADSLIDLSFCSGDSIVVNGTVYNQSNPSGVETLENQSSNGCDSIVTIDLEFTNDINIMITNTLCPGEFVDVNGTIFDESSPSGQVVISGSGCDSIFDIDLSFYDQADTLITGQYCSDFSVIVNGATYDLNNPSGSETLLNSSQFGCDSIVAIDLDFFPEAMEDFMMTICDNESIDVNGTIYNSSNLSGTEIITGGSTNGCDSTVNVQLTLLQSYDIDDSATICDGDSIFLQGAWQFSAGSYVDSLLTVDMCDSIINTEVTTISCAFVVTIGAIDNVCSGGSEGSIAVDIQTILTEDVTVSWNGATSGNSGSIVTVGLNGMVEIPSLISDNYTVTITDSDGNILFESTIQVVDLNPAISGSWTVVDSIPCFGETGTIEFEPQGGQSPFSYTWDDNNIGDSPIATGINAGTYAVTISDTNGCTFDTSFTLIDALEFSADISIMDLSCEGSADGQISIIDIQGGLAPYTINVNGSTIDSTEAIGLDTGMYTIDIVDANNCMLSFIEEINSGSAPDFAAYIDEYSITEGDSVAIQSTIVAGNYTFEWINNTDGLSCTDCANPVASPISTTVYDVVITDENGCTQSVSLLVTVDSELIVDVVPNIFTPNGDNQNEEFTFISNEAPTLGISMRIFDRWGNLIHTTQVTGNRVSWDGTRGGQQLFNGVFVYEIIIQYEDGTSTTKYGDVVLIN